MFYIRKRLAFNPLLFCILNHLDCTFNRHLIQNIFAAKSDRRKINKISLQFVHARVGIIAIGNRHIRSIKQSGTIYRRLNATEMFALTKLIAFSKQSCLRQGDVVINRFLIALRLSSCQDNSFTCHSLSPTYVIFIWFDFLYFFFFCGNS